MAEMSQVEIPNRALFKASEVCDLAKLQPYVLRSWEAEFKDLGMVRSGSTARVYRREDVERVLRIKHLVLIEGLTLAGVRRRLEEEAEPPLEEELPAAVAAPTAIGDEVRQRIREVRRGLRALLDLLEAPGAIAVAAGHAAVGAAAASAEFALTPAKEVVAESKPARRAVAKDEGSGRSSSPRRKRSA